MYTEGVCTYTETVCTYTEDVCTYTCVQRGSEAVCMTLVFSEDLKPCTHIDLALVPHRTCVHACGSEECELRRSKIETCCHVESSHACRVGTAYTSIDIYCTKGNIIFFLGTCKWDIYDRS